MKIRVENHSRSNKDFMSPYYRFSIPGNTSKELDLTEIHANPKIPVTGADLIQLFRDNGLTVTILDPEEVSGLPHARGGVSESTDPEPSSEPAVEPAEEGEPKKEQQSEKYSKRHKPKK